jgi:hypothetical protein
MPCKSITPDLQRLLTAQAADRSAALSGRKWGCKERHWSGYKFFGRGRDHRTLALLAEK